MLSLNIDSSPTARWGEFETPREDPALKLLGSIIKAFYLDRLPRLINVVMGDMSLIGPEAMEAIGVSPLDDPRWASAYTAKPGIFRPSKLVQRAARSLEGTVSADSTYLNAWSLRKDFQLLVQIAFARCGNKLAGLLSWATDVHAGDQAASSLTVSGEGSE